MEETARGRPISSAPTTLQGYGRGLLGSLLVGIPLLATMEMWWLGFTLPPLKLLLFLVANFGLLVVLEFFSGFEEGHVRLRDEVQDSIDAYGMAFVVAVIVLFLFGVIGPGMSLREIAGKVILQSIPLSIGASVAISVLGERDPSREPRRRRAGFWGFQLIGVAGAVYFGFNIAPTDEPLRIGLSLVWWHAVLLLLFSILLTHLIVYSVGFLGSREPPHPTLWKSLVEHGILSYMSALLVAAFLLWMFGRIGPDTGLTPALHITITLGFVTALGSAAARLII